VKPRWMKLCPKKQQHPTTDIVCQCYMDTAADSGSTTAAGRGCAWGQQAHWSGATEVTDNVAWYVSFDAGSAGDVRCQHYEAWKLELCESCTRNSAITDKPCDAFVQMQLCDLPHQNDPPNMCYHAEFGHSR